MSQYIANIRLLQDEVAKLSTRRSKLTDEKVLYSIEQAFTRMNRVARDTIITLMSQSTFYEYCDAIQHLVVFFIRNYPPKPSILLPLITLLSNMLDISSSITDYTLQRDKILCIFLDLLISLTYSDNIITIGLLSAPNITSNTAAGTRELYQHYVNLVENKILSQIYNIIIKYYTPFINAIISYSLSGFVLLLQQQFGHFTELFCQGVFHTTLPTAADDEKECRDCISSILCISSPFLLMNASDSTMLTPASIPFIYTTATDKTDKSHIYRDGIYSARIGFGAGHILNMYMSYLYLISTIMNDSHPTTTPNHLLMHGTMHTFILQTQYYILDILAYYILSYFNPNNSHTLTNPPMSMLDAHEDSCYVSLIIQSIFTQDTLYIILSYITQLLSLTLAPNPPQQYSKILMGSTRFKLPQSSLRLAMSIIKLYQFIFATITQYAAQISWHTDSLLLSNKVSLLTNIVVNLNRAGYNHRLNSWVRCILSYGYSRHGADREDTTSPLSIHFARDMIILTLVVVGGIFSNNILQYYYDKPRHTISNDTTTTTASSIPLTASSSAASVSTMDRPSTTTNKKAIPRGGSNPTLTINPRASKHGVLTRHATYAQSIDMIMSTNNLLLDDSITSTSPSSLQQIRTSRQESRSLFLLSYARILAYILNNIDGYRIHCANMNGQRHTVFTMNDLVGFQCMAGLLLCGPLVAIHNKSICTYAVATYDPTTTPSLSRQSPSSASLTGIGGNRTESNIYKEPTILDIIKDTPILSSLLMDSITYMIKNKHIAKASMSSIDTSVEYIAHVLEPQSYPQPNNTRPDVLSLYYPIWVLIEKTPVEAVTFLLNSPHLVSKPYTIAPKTVPSSSSSNIPPAAPPPEIVAPPPPTTKSKRHHQQIRDESRDSFHDHSSVRSTSPSSRPSSPTPSLRNSIARQSAVLEDSIRHSLRLAEGIELDDDSDAEVPIPESHLRPDTQRDIKMIHSRSDAAALLQQQKQSPQSQAPWQHETPRQVLTLPPSPTSKDTPAMASEVSTLSPASSSEPQQPQQQPTTGPLTTPSSRRTTANPDMASLNKQQLEIYKEYANGAYGENTDHAQPPVTISGPDGKQRTLPRNSVFAQRRYSTLRGSIVPQLGPPPPSTTAPTPTICNNPSTSTHAAPSAPTPLVQQQQYTPQVYSTTTTQHTIIQQPTPQVATQHGPIQIHAMPTTPAAPTVPLPAPTPSAPMHNHLSVAPPSSMTIVENEPMTMPETRPTGFSICAEDPQLVTTANGRPPARLKSVSGPAGLHGPTRLQSVGAGGGAHAPHPPQISPRNAPPQPHQPHAVSLRGSLLAHGHPEHSAPPPPPPPPE